MGAGSRGIAARTEHGCSVITDGDLGGSPLESLGRARTAELLFPPPRTNLIHPRTVLVALTARLPAGDHMLCCAVAAFEPGTGPESLEALIAGAPPVPKDALDPLLALVGAGECRDADTLLAELRGPAHQPNHDGGQ